MSQSKEGMVKQPLRFPLIGGSNPSRCHFFPKCLPDYNISPGLKTVVDRKSKLIMSRITFATTAIFSQLWRFVVTFRYNLGNGHNYFQAGRE